MTVVGLSGMDTHMYNYLTQELYCYTYQTCVTIIYCHCTFVNACFFPFFFFALTIFSASRELAGCLFFQLSQERDPGCPI